MDYRGRQRRLVGKALALSALVPGFVPGYAHAQTSSGAKPSGDLQVLRWAVSLNLQAAAVFVGVEKGIFVAHGLDVKVRQLDGAAQINTALQAGEADLGFSALGGLISARGQGIKVRGVGILAGDGTVKNTDNFYSIIASSGSRITKPADLVGKKLAVPGGSAETYARAVLDSIQVPHDKVQWVNVSQNNQVSALRSGSIDAAVFGEHQGELALATVPGARTVIRGGGFIAQRIVVPGMEEWIAKNRNLTERALVALAEAMQYTRGHLDEAADITGRWSAGGVDPAILRKAIRHISFDPRVTPAIPASWVSENESLLKFKRIRGPVPYSEGFDAAFMEKIQREHPKYFADLKGAR
ncbi:MAG TPA: ABC transporter substrate-binding protein [Ramlibacter sp.]|nr:ABC transporter substrate-binding protein [Ramlibacter sp.]